MNLPCSVHSAANNGRSSDISRAKFTHFRLMVRQNVQTFFKSNIIFTEKKRMKSKVFMLSLILIHKRYMSQRLN